MANKIGGRCMYLEWIVYGMSLVALAFQLNIVTVMIFIICTFIFSFNKPIFAITSFQCALIANTYLENYYYLNFALCGIFVIIFLLRISSFRYIDKVELPLLFAFTYSLILSIINEFANIEVIVVFMLIVVLTRLFVQQNYISLEEIVTSMAITSCFSGVVGLLENTYGLSYGAGSVNRFLSSYGDPNFFCMLSIAAIVGIMYCPKSKIKIIAIFVISVFCTLTFSKSMLILAGMNIIIFLFKSTVDLNKKIHWIVIGIVGLFILNWIISNLYSQNIILNYLFRFTQESVGESGISSLTTGRSGVQKAFLEYFFNSQPITKILFGNGYIGTRNIAPLIGINVDTTHMVYLQILMDFGIVGFGIYLYVFIKGFLTAGTVQRHMLVTFFVAMFSLSWQFTIPYFGFYLLLFNNQSIKNEKIRVGSS